MWRPHPVVRSHCRPRQWGHRLSAQGRPELAKVISRLEPGDVLVVTRLDRLARSTRNLPQRHCGVRAVRIVRPMPRTRRRTRRNAFRPWSRRARDVGANRQGVVALVKTSSTSTAGRRLTAPEQLARYTRYRRVGVSQRSSQNPATGSRQRPANRRRKIL